MEPVDPIVNPLPDIDVAKYCVVAVRPFKVIPLAEPIEAAQYGVEPAPADVKTLPAVPAAILPNVVEEEAYKISPVV